MSEDTKQQNTKAMQYDTVLPPVVQKSIKTVIERMQHHVSSMLSQDCTFWACDGTPENNRIRTMVTCSRCQTIITTNREIKKLEKLLPNGR